MQTYLDGQAIEAKTPSLAGAIAAGAQVAQSQGRIVVEVAVDGEPVTGEALAAPSDEALDDGAEVRLATADPRQLSTQAIADARTQLQQARDRQSRCAALIQGGDMTEAMDLMGQCLADWQAAQAVTMSVTRLMNIEPESNTVDALAGRLEEVKHAVAGKDWATLADLLAYDLDEQAHNWIAMLDRMHDAVAQ